MKLKDKNVVVYGLGKSGQELVKFLISKKANVFVYDDNLQVLEDFNRKNYTITALKNLCELNLKIMDYMIVSPAVSIYSEGVKLAVLLGVEVMGELEFASRFIKSNIIAVTGTNGKTTTVNLIKNIFNFTNTKSVLAGNVGIPLVSTIHTKKHNTIVEVSSFMLETIKYFSPNIACILNITQDHLDRHFTFENYFKSKLRIVENMTKKDYLVINADDKLLVEYFSKKLKPNIVWFSKNKEVDGAFVKDGSILYKKNKITNYICDLKDIKLVGEHNLENVLCAVCVSMISKIKTSYIKNAIQGFKPIAHRLEFVREVNGIKFYNDSKSTTIASTLKAVNSFSNNQVLILGGFDKQLDYSILAQKLPSLVKMCVVYGDAKIKISNALKKEHKPYFVVDDFSSALNASLEFATIQDIVLLSPACASYDEFDSYTERGDMFKKFVMSLNGD